jgi:DNA-binding HxlR family transcriptional regulator
MASDRAYKHFCMMARTLEVVGERWSLLIVRDLLPGPRRFGDLASGLGQITPTRLTDRLRRLEAAGLVVRQPPSAGREVWYRLTDAGRDLAATVDSLVAWGIEHTLEPPQRDDLVPAAPVMLGTKVWLAQHGVAPRKAVAWVWRFHDDDPYTIGYESGGWTLARGKAETAQVTVASTVEAWARFLTTPRDDRRLPQEGIRLEAPRAEAIRLVRAFRAEFARPKQANPAAADAAPRLGRNRTTPS